MAYYPKMEVVQIENAFLVEVREPMQGKEDFDYEVERKEFAYLSIDNVFEKMQEVFKQDGK